MTATIVLVEDDVNQRDILQKLLIDNGFSVRSVGSGAEAIKLLDNFKPDIVLLDLGLPDISGESVFEEIKKNYQDLPVIFLTAKGGSSDIVEGLNLGAEDYVTKPYNIEELVARIRARLHHGDSNDKLEVGDLILNGKTYEVTRGDKKITLTPKEFKLLEYLMVNRGQVLSRDMILSRVWMYSPDMQTRAVDVYVGYLRKKVDEGFNKPLIRSIRGYGYMIKD